MNPTRVFAILLRYYYLLRGSPARVFSLYVWVTINMVMWGFISRYMSSISSTGFSLVPAFLGRGVAIGFYEPRHLRYCHNVFRGCLVA